jgi:hypothetical protein
LPTTPSKKCLTELGDSDQRRLSVGGAIGFAILDILDFRFWILDFGFWILRNEGAGRVRYPRAGAEPSAPTKSANAARSSEPRGTNDTAKQEVPDRAWDRTNGSSQWAGR